MSMKHTPSSHYSLMWGVWQRQFEHHLFGSYTGEELYLLTYTAVYLRYKGIKSKEVYQLLGV